MSIDFQGINANLLARSRDFLSHLFPAGKVRGHEFVVGDIDGNPGESLSINLDKGCGSDFATGEVFSDLIAVYAAHHRIGMGEAAKRLSNGAGERYREPPSDVTRPPVSDTPSCHHHSYGYPSHVYRYEDTQGLLFVVARYTTPSGKQIMPWAWTGSQWTPKSYTKPRPLYGLRELQANPEAKVILVEGEKCVDRLRAMGIARTPISWAGGAQAWKHADWSPLKGRDVLLFPDHDAPGWSAIAGIASRINASKLQVIDHRELDLPDCWDIADEEWTSADLNKWAAPLIKPFEVPRETVQQDEPPPADENYEPAPYERDEPDAWDAPVDLWSERPVAPLSIASLPVALQEYVAEMSDLMGTDPTVLGMASLVVCSSVIDDKITVQPKEFDTSWTESARLWSAIVGNPSSMKTPGMKASMAPIKSIEASLAERSKDEMREYDEAMAEYQRARGKDKGSPPQKPALPRTYTSNATVESLSDILQDNPQGILCFADELSSWFGSMDAYAKGAAGKDKGLWLEAYNGGSQRIDRVTRGHLFIPNWSVCMLGGIQPEAFRTVAKRMDNDGLLQRFMIVMAARAKNDVDRVPNSEVIRGYHHLVHSLRDLRIYPEVPFKFSPEAQEVRRVFMDVVKQAQSTLLPRGVEGYLGKWTGLFARLALTYHLIDAGGRPKPEISVDTAMRVASLMENTLYPHAIQFYGEQLGQNDLWEHTRWIAGHILAKRITSFATRDLVQAYRSMRDLSDYQKAAILFSLVELGWIRGKKDARITGASRCPTNWDVNPVIAETLQARRDIEIAARKRRMEQLRESVDGRDSDNN